MANATKQRDKLIELLKELFQLDRPELDFGLYKIMHSKSGQITKFLEEELSEEIDKVFGEAGGETAEQHLETVKQKVIQTLGEEAFDQNGELLETYRNLPLGKEYLAALETVLSGGGMLSDAAQVYDHLYRFFNRYYDSGDFMSMRYHVAENSSRAAPYAVPYDGREVYLHWANKDQYYIKTTESFNSYTFDLNEAVQKEQQRQGQTGLGLESAENLKVYFKLVDAEEGEHNNVKENASRFFIIHDAEPVKLNEAGELEIQFQYRADPKKSGQDRKWQEKKIAEAETIIIEALEQLANADGYKAGLKSLAPTDKQKDRTMLAKYLLQYTARNTMDYFIHKDLGGFLRRELDFYIKNEIMRLDDVEQADAPAVEEWLSKIKVIRKIAKRVIDFLAQLEDFQKKLWLKKKFVVDTQYCITLDRLFPENQDWEGYTDEAKQRKTERLNKLLEEIAANEEQRDEWVRLFAIDDLKGDLVTAVYSEPLTVEFLKANPFLIIDTKVFPQNFKNELLSLIDYLDQTNDGVIIDSDNFHALNIINKKHERAIDSVYIDPPYNSPSSEIVYKNNYKHSSWATLMDNRIRASKKLLIEDYVYIIAIDENEGCNLEMIEKAIFQNSKNVTVAVRHNPRGQQGKNVSYTHEYAHFIYPGDDKKRIADVPRNEIDSRNLRDSGTESDRTDAKNCFYPIIINEQNEIINVGEIPADIYHPEAANIELDDGNIEIWPLDESNNEKKWRYSLQSISKILDALVIKKGRTALQVYYNKESGVMRTIWDSAKYDASEYGTKVLQAMFGNEVTSIFSYPKSIYTVIDSIKAANSDIVLDYFAGSGTTGHAVIHLNREEDIKRKFILIEMGNYIDLVTIPRIKKAIYSSEWSSGNPVTRDGISSCFKYLRLESYEDAINNLIVTEDQERDKTIKGNPDLKRDYLLNYLLDSETAGSPSLLNIQEFADPTAYKLKIKQSGRDEYVEQPVDLVETFNWLIGLHVELLDRPRTYQAEFEREKDPELSENQHTRLKVKGRLREAEEGDYWLRLVEGWVCRTPGDDSVKDKVLVVWRKLTDDAEKDAAVLEQLLERYKVNQADSEYDIIYVNCTHGLQLHGEAKARLVSLEETFLAQMWAEADPGRVH